MKPIDAGTLAQFAAPILEGLGYELVDLEWRPEAGTWVLRVFIDFRDSRDLQDLAAAGTADGEAGGAPAEPHPTASLTASPATSPTTRRISHDDCARASRALGAELDVADLIPCAFNLEVSSPGLNRPLKREADYRRFTGSKARVRTRQPLAGTVTEKSPGGRRNFAGRILGTRGGRILLDVDGQAFEIPLEEVDKANLVYEFDV